MHIGEIKMFLAAKKQERDFKLKCLRDSDKNTSNTSMNTPSDRCSATLHPVQPTPLLHSASGSTENYTALHRTAHNGNQESSANPGTRNVSGNLLLADSSKNLG